MKTMIEITEQLKDILSLELNGKVYDKDVAAELGVSQMAYATQKKRNKLCFIELSIFCAKRRISLNWLLFDQAPESLVESTNRFELHHLGIAS